MCYLSQDICIWKMNQGHEIMNCISILESGRDQLLIFFLPLAADLLLSHVLLGIYPAVLEEISEYALSFWEDFWARRTPMDHFWMPLSHQACLQRAELPKRVTASFILTRKQNQTYSPQNVCLFVLPFNDESSPIGPFQVPIQTNPATEMGGGMSVS